jgi:HipA-like protein
MAYKTDIATIDLFQLAVFSESRKRRLFVGTLSWNQTKNYFEFKYDSKYARSKKAIPIGKELDLFKKTHTSKGKLFPSFADRIPSKDNPAYADYCKAQGISVDETNPIILLTGIGRKGPSTFIFEPIVKNEFKVETIRKFREEVGLSINDMALAFDLNPPTLQRLETGKKTDLGTIRRVQIYLTFPKVALWQLEMNMGKLHSETSHKLWTYLENLAKQIESDCP